MRIDIIKDNPIANFLRWKIIEERQKKIIRKLQKKEKINVVFFAMQKSIWKYQNLYELMCKNERFNVSIVLSPAQNFDRAQQLEDVKELRMYFKEKGTFFFDYDVDNPQNTIDVRKELDPDILFYPQPYSFLLNTLHDSRFFYDKLLAYYPYAFWTTGGKWGYDTVFHLKAWKLFYSTQYNMDDAREFASNKGKNVVIVGYPTIDDFKKTTFNSEWKESKEGVKKIIWAPHFSIDSHKSPVKRGNFLWMAEEMVNIAKEYAGKVQFMFKPHPRLLTELYQHNDWGRIRTDKYFQSWKDMPNTSISRGDYIDLFMTSDAMIHDCGSFSVEYLLTGKPVMFVTRDEVGYRKHLNGLGNSALDQHYIANKLEQIRMFINECVIKENDPKHICRKDYVDNLLLPNKNISVAENTMQVITKELGIN